MEIKLSAGDKIQVPAGCKATIKENTIVIEEEQKQEEFKDGDILHSKTTDRVVIFKSYEDELNDLIPYFSSYYNNSNSTNSSWGGCYFRHATEEEKQSFFDNLKNKGLHWNAETKEMEKVRKRVERGEKYLFIGRGICVYEITDFNDTADNENYNLGNYYLLSEREEAEEDAKAIRAIFEKRKKVIQD